MRLIPQSVIAHLSGEGCSNYTFFVFFFGGFGSWSWKYRHPRRDWMNLRGDISRPQQLQTLVLGVLEVTRLVRQGQGVTSLFTKMM